MCLAIPARVEKIDETRGTVELNGNRAEVLFDLVPGVQVGDWVLVHAGVAIVVLDAAEAAETYDLLRQMERLA